MRLSSLMTVAAVAALGLMALVDPALAGNGQTNGRIPEPGTLGLLAAGAAGVAYRVPKRRK
jgi:hypothetical protein